MTEQELRDQLATWLYGHYCRDVAMQDWENRDVKYREKWLRDADNVLAIIRDKKVTSETL